MREVATGATETLGEAELDGDLAVPSPLAFWRERRGLTEADLAHAAGITERDLAPIERGSHGGDVAVFARLARALRVRIEDLLPPN